jgi:hypothetical protein
MEGITPTEKVAAMDLDSYIKALPAPYEVDGKIMEDENHLFYYWLSKTYLQFKDIDGVSLEDLYLKNVIESEMSETDFFRYCERNKFPVPILDIDENGMRTGFDQVFTQFKNNERNKKNKAYELWAVDHGIVTTPGSIMKFYSSEGNLYRVCTDLENYGKIIKTSI